MRLPVDSFTASRGTIGRLDADQARGVKRAKKVSAISHDVSAEAFPVTSTRSSMDPGSSREGHPTSTCASRNSGSSSPDRRAAIPQEPVPQECVSDWISALIVHAPVPQSQEESIEVTQLIPQERSTFVSKFKKNPVWNVVPQELVQNRAVESSRRAFFCGGTTPKLSSQSHGSAPSAPQCQLLT